VLTPMTIGAKRVILEAMAAMLASATFIAVLRGADCDVLPVPPARIPIITPEPEGGEHAAACMSVLDTGNAA
jgi:hypothetical protein